MHAGAPAASSGVAPFRHCSGIAKGSRRMHGQDGSEVGVPVGGQLRSSAKVRRGMDGWMVGGAAVVIGEGVRV